MSSAEPRRSPKRASKHKPPRPDEMSGEVIEFINAIDEFKRRNMVAHLSLESVLAVVHELGYASPIDGGDGAELAFLAEALDEYKRAHKRLFPNWSEVFGVLREIGYQRGA